MYKKQQQKDYSLLSQRQRMSPFPNYMSMESVCNDMQDFVGVNLDRMMLFFRQRVMQVFLQSDSFEAAGKYILKAVNENPSLYATLVAKQEADGPALVNFTKEAKQTVSTRTTNQELYDLFVGYEQRYKQVYAGYGSVWVVEDHLMSQLYAIVEKRITNDPGQASDMLNTLTKQPSAMVATIERRALLKMAVEVAKHNDWVQAVKKKDHEVVKQIDSLQHLITAHANAYFWVTRDYEDPILDEEKIIDRLAEILDDNPQETYAVLIEKLDTAAKKRETYIKELALTDNELALFEAMREAAHLKELRKRYVSESLYYFDDVLTEIGRRTYLSMTQVRLMRTKDVHRALIDGEDVADELNERMTLSVWSVQTGQETDVLTGKPAWEMYQEFCGIDKEAKEFTGMPVSPGVARGPVKIVMNPDECDKVENGDVIVSVQVVPSFSTAIMKSAAIICDGGHGITSHPATLAREAGIPCIIQTRFAREVLKDGDMVEVDGYKGVARVVEQD